MPDISETEWQTQVIQLAKTLGWHVMHVRKAIGRRRGAAAWQTPTSIAGWPDLFLFHPVQGRTLALELKSRTGVVEDEQARVLERLAASGVPGMVARPADLDTLTRLLQKPRPPIHH